MVVEGREEMVDKVEGGNMLSWMVFIGWGLFVCGILGFSLYLSFFNYIHTKNLSVDKEHTLLCVLLFIYFLLNNLIQSPLLFAHI